MTSSMYPRCCNRCGKTYKSKETYYKHKKAKRCERHVDDKTPIIHAESKIVINDMTEILREENAKLNEKLAQLEITNSNVLQEVEQLKRMMPNNVKIRQPLDEIIYILETRHCFECQLDVFKIGRCFKIEQRKLGYPKGSRVVAQFACRNSKELEQTVLTALRATFKQRKDFGAEYFEAPLHLLIAKVSEIYCAESIKNY